MKMLMKWMILLLQKHLTQNVVEDFNILSDLNDHLDDTQDTVKQIEQVRRKLYLAQVEILPGKESLEIYVSKKVLKQRAGLRRKQNNSASIRLLLIGKRKQARRGRRKSTRKQKR